MDASIKLENVSYLNDNMILEDISININSQITFIMGESGCGKTTLLEVISGFKVITTGNIQILDLIISSASNFKTYKKLHKNVLLVFQNAQKQFLTSKVLDELLIGVKNNHFNVDEKKKLIEEMLIAFKIELNILEKNVYYLSGGEKKIIALISLLILEPKVLLLDEPTAGLDSILGKKILEYVIKFATQKNIQLIITSHNVDEVYNYAQDIIFMNKGHVLFKGQYNKFASYCIQHKMDLFISKEYQYLMSINKSFNSSFTSIEMAVKYVQNKPCN